MDLRIDDFADLDRLARAMDDLADQSRQLGDYLSRWVCNRSGFETSDVCLFRPIGAVLGQVAGAFDDFTGAFDRDWRRLADGVLATERALADLDDEVVAALDRVVA